MREMDNLSLESDHVLHILEEYVEGVRDRGNQQFSVQHQLVENFLGHDGKIGQGHLLQRSDGHANGWRKMAQKSQSQKLTTISDLSKQKKGKLSKIIQFFRSVSNWNIHSEP